MTGRATLDEGRVQVDNRANGILEMLIDRERMEVSEIAKEMGVSQVTVRKYLNELESRGLITREHGYAAIKSTDNVEGRLARHYEQKLRIARRAVACVPDGATVIVENGSCCALLAVELAHTKRTSPSSLTAPLWPTMSARLATARLF